MTFKHPFAPAFTHTVSIAVTTGSATATIKKGNKQLRLTNAGTGLAFVRAYNSANGAQAATVTDFPVLPSARETITVDEDFDTIAAITATGTATLYITPGEGW